MTEPTLILNGIRAGTGDYITPPLPINAIARLAQGQPITTAERAECRRRMEQNQFSHFGVRAGIDTRLLRQTGWAAVFPQVAPNSAADRRQRAILEALQPLLQLRRTQASADHEPFFRLVTGPDGLRPGESKGEFLARFGTGAGPADPRKFPYYVLLVGNPAEIPFRVQQQLDVQYAVGRLDFNEIEDFARYAQSVVASEQPEFGLPKSAAFWGVANPSDRATAMSSEYLIAPLSQQFLGQTAWDVRVLTGNQATHAALADLLHGDNAPALVFTASHGVGFDPGDKRQMAHQGALLCQDWPGPGSGELVKDWYFSGEDVGNDANLLGRITFHFACYGGGTPNMDEFWRMAYDKPQVIAPAPFVAALPKKLLSHPRGGALATIAHTDRAWGYSFLSPGVKPDAKNPQTVVFESVLEQLAAGFPVGAAVDFLNERYAEIACDLASRLDDIDNGKQIDAYDLANLWTANNDARGYGILGDPAVRLKISDRPTTTRTNLPPITITQRQPTESLPDAFGEDETEMNTRLDTTGKQLDYGLFSSKDGDDPSAFRQLVQKAAEVLSAAVANATTLTVRTYTTADFGVTPDGVPENAQLRAMTRIALDGDTDVYVPTRNGEIEEPLWNVHQETVKVAQAHRTELLRSAVALFKGE